MPECVRVWVIDYMCKGQGAEGNMGCLRKWTYKTSPEQVEGRIEHASQGPGLHYAVWLLAW